MSKTIIVSNRLPIKISEVNGEYVSKTSEGGLATGLSSILNDDNSLWIGWPGMEIDEKDQPEIISKLRQQKLLPVFLSQEEITQYYEGFSNEILWPVFHYMPTYARYESSYWEFYESVNKKFSDAINSILEPGDIIWVHDYQLLLLPSMIREEHEEVTIGFFQHIPFPSFELFRLIPWREELLKGMLGADLLGFHTYDDARHFLTSASRLLQVQCTSNIILYNDRSIAVESFPMGIDAEKFESIINDEDVQQEVSHLRENFTGVRLILSIDRLDYSKGILQRLQAFDIFLQNNPEYIEKVSMYMIVVPSRDTVLQYKELRDEIDKLAGNINARFRTNNWAPLNYFYRSFPIETLSALYQFSDVCLVTPLRDGMNLVCKEYVASRVKNNGVLILSEMAGASKELVDAILVNPNNVIQMSEAIVEALNMPLEEQMQRMIQMKQLVEKYNVNNWVKVFMERLKEAKRMQQSLQTKYIGSRTQQYIKSKYVKARKRLLLLDYDGTLVGFNNNINLAVPDKELYSILEDLTQDEKNHVVIISGRKHTTLEEWFGHLKLDLIGEHGVWFKQYKESWQQMKGLTSDWKKDILPLLKSYTERTPGSFIEEKSFSLVWHYRKAESELGEIRSNELMNNLRYLITDLGLQLLAGNKVVEIKNIEVNKGKTAQHYMQKDNYDFVLAIGDDTTDEDMFKALKDEAFTIKVNSNLSAAKYYLRDFTEVRNFLKNISSKLLLSRVLDRVLNLLPASVISRKKH